MNKAKVNIEMQIFKRTRSQWTNRPTNGFSNTTPRSDTVRSKRSTRAWTLRVACPSLGASYT